MDDFGDLAGNAIDNHDRRMINEQLGTLLNQGIRAFEEQANDNHDRHMRQIDEQLGTLLNQGIRAFEEQTNDNHDRRIRQINEQLGTLLNQGIRAFEEQANDLNRTAEETAQDIRHAADAFEGTASIRLILSFIGPLQVVAELNHFSQVVRNLDDVARPIPQSIQELKDTNIIPTNVADATHEGGVRRRVRSLTDSSVRFDRETGKLTTYFFYTQNNSVVDQLIGPDENNPNYFAYDSIRDLLSAVFCWNEYLDFLENRNENLVRLGSRRTIVYFLDPPPINIVLSKVEFLQVYKDISFINYCRSRAKVKLKSIKVHEGCSVRLESFTVCKIDGACEDEVDLYKCALGWDPNKRVDRVTCNECEKMKTSWKRKLKIAVFKSKEQRF
eukprot:scaffold8120_cov73-Cylindrotheca_fusiformis.AAC.4